MKFVTFNIRYDTPHDGINAFKNRAGNILDKIAREKPDVIGFQECLPHVFEFLRAYLRDYAIAGGGRGADYGDEHNPVAFLRDKYELISLDTQWLSPTPYAPGSRYPEQSTCPRIVTAATLLPKAAPTPFHVFNTHLDHESDQARVMGAQQVCRVMRDALARRPLPAVLMGDFNALPASAPIKIFMEDKCLSLVDHTANIPCSFHNYGRESVQKIDYILSHGMRAMGAATAWDDINSGIYLSDHYPLAIELELEK